MRACVCLLCAGLSIMACDVTPKTPPPTTTTPEKLLRPPQPMLAGPAYGEQVALELGRDVQPNMSTTARAELDAAMTLLWGMQPGSEKEAQTRALHAWKLALDNQTRGHALALVSVAMVFEPTATGYAERLTDAYGLGLYAGTVDHSVPEAQAARAIVAAAGGATRQAHELLTVIGTLPRLSEGAVPWLALARGAINDRSEVFVTDAQKGIAARPDAWRLRTMLADKLNELGAYDDAIAALDIDNVGPRPHAASVSLARARVLTGRAADIATATTELKALDAALSGNDELRRGEVQSLLVDTALLAEPPALIEARTAAALLEPRAGFGREARAARVALALADSNVDEAKAQLDPILKGTPGGPVLIERRLSALAILVCGRLRDTACVEQAARRLSVVDVDPELIRRMRAFAVRTSEDKLRAPLSMWREATAPDDNVQRVLTARRALVSNNAALARKYLAGITDKRSGAAKVLLARAQVDDDAKAAHAVLALQGRPALLEDDLLDVLDLLGAAPTKEGPKLLSGFENDARAAVARRARRSLAELKDPSLRKKRLEPQDADGHGGHADHGQPHLPLPRAP